MKRAKTEKLNIILLLFSVAGLILGIAGLSSPWFRLNAIPGASKQFGLFGLDLSDAGRELSAVRVFGLLAFFFTFSALSGSIVLSLGQFKIRYIFRIALCIATILMGALTFFLALEFAENATQTYTISAGPYLVAIGAILGSVPLPFYKD